MARIPHGPKAIGKACKKAAGSDLVLPADPEPKAAVGVKRLRVKEYAQRYGVSESTVREWIRNGKVKFEQPAGKKGRIFLYDGM